MYYLNLSLRQNSSKQPSTIALIQLFSVTNAQGKLPTHQGPYFKINDPQLLFGYTSTITCSSHSWLSKPLPTHHGGLHSPFHKIMDLQANRCCRTCHTWHIVMKQRCQRTSDHFGMLVPVPEFVCVLRCVRVSCASIKCVLLHILCASIYTVCCALIYTVLCALAEMNGAGCAHA